MNDPALSIITINYNNYQGLSKTIESVTTQSFKNFEYIIIDGGSTDASLEVIRKNADKIDYQVSEKDRGIYHAMNKGITKATGEYILFVNSGDLLVSNTILNEIVPALTGEDIICGDYEVIGLGSKWIKQYPDTLSFSYFISDSLAHSAAAFTKRDAFTGDLAQYDENLKIVSDWKWYLVGIYKYNYTYKHIPRIIGKFDFNGTSATNPGLTTAEKEEVFTKEFKNIYHELAEASSYKVKYQILASSRFMQWYLSFKKIFS